MSEPRIETVDIVLPLEQSENEEARLLAAAGKLGLPADRIRQLRLRKHSIDARQRQIKVQLRLDVGVDADQPQEPLPVPDYPAVPANSRRVIIVGSGPAGLFAGTFSDGKLYTRAKKRGPVAEVYRTLVAHGAPERILIDSHPHIGSNLLPNVVKALRQSILNAGGEVHFQTRVADFLIEAGRMRGVVCAEGREYIGDSVILATGHSARDIYRLLAARKVRLEQKPFAVGVRIEHPQPLIDSLQYHYPQGTERPLLLPAASYQLATKIDDRGVHSFCMCPGGFIVPAATENDEVVVNGMSLSRRDSPFANSGMVVTVEPEDTTAFAGEHGILAGVAYQRALETAAKRHGGGGQAAPAQRALDFIAGRASPDMPDTSYRPGLNPARLDEILPQGIVSRLKRGLNQFGRKSPGYLCEEAVLVGFETRTSSPVRIPRNDQLQHPEIVGLHPCGEGAGYAGGIVSAAIDGLRCAEAAAHA